MASFYFSRFTHSRVKKAKVSRARAHSLRLKAEIEKPRMDGKKTTLEGICNPEKSHENELMYRTPKGLKPLDDVNDQERLQRFFNLLENYSNKPNSTLADEIQEKITAGVKNFYRLKTSSKTDLQKDFFEEIHNNLLNKIEFNPDEYIERLKEIEKTEGVKIRGFGAKIKNIKSASEAISEANKINLVDVSPLTITSAEYVITIPKRNEIILGNDDFKGLATEFRNKFLPGYEFNYMAIHHDESVPHIHFEIDGRNPKTRKFDLNQTTFDSLRKIRPDLEFSSEKYSKLSKDDIRNLGVAIQDEMHKLANRYVKNKYPDKEIKRRTAEEIAADPRTFKDKVKRKTDRELNAQKELRAENQNLMEKKQNLMEKNNNLERGIDEKSSLLQSLTEQVNYVTKKLNDFKNKYFPPFSNFIKNIAPVPTLPELNKMIEEETPEDITAIQAIINEEIQPENTQEKLRKNQVLSESEAVKKGKIKYKI